MPAEGRTPLTPDEIARIRAWVLAGAPPDLASVPGIFIAGDGTKRQHPLAITAHSWARFGRCSNRKEQSWSRYRRIPSDGLILRTTDVAGTFDDAQLAKFQRFAPFIVEAELGRTAVTDASIETLAQFKNLRALHLEGTVVNGRTLGKLSSLIATQLT